MPGSYQIKKHQLKTNQNLVINPNSNSARIYHVTHGLAEFASTPNTKKELIGDDCTKRFFAPAGATGVISNASTPTTELLEISFKMSHTHTQSTHFHPAISVQDANNEQPPAIVMKDLNGKQVNEAITDFPKIPNAPCNVAIATIAPNCHTGAHRHPREGEKKEVDGKAYRETYVIVSGAGYLNLDGTKIDFTAGTILNIEPGQWHQLHNTDQNKDVVLAVICEPSWCISCMILPTPEDNIPPINNNNITPQM